MRTRLGEAIENLIAAKQRLDKEIASGADPYFTELHASETESAETDLLVELDKIVNRVIDERLEELKTHTGRTQSSER